MRRALKIHPDSRCPAVSQVEVRVTRPRAGTLMLRYIVSGDIGVLVLPPLGESARTAVLWQHTCFEAFIRPGLDEAYYEFNFASSTQWAAYRFDRHREGMRIAGEIDAPRIELERTPDRFRLQATLQWNESSDLGRGATWRLGLSVILEQTDGHKSYWALAHPPGKPDFHHADCFALKLQ